MGTVISKQFKVQGSRFNVTSPPTRNSEPCPETCMMDVEAHHECSIRDTMVEILAIGSRRHFDGKPNIYSPGV
jgi:hypothetical protein